MSGAPLTFFRDSGSVRWYRGLSRMQTKACDGLHYALRDDSEQGSTFRVRRLLVQLGLHPLVRSAHISAIMGISQCSDLAFLWFLWEAAYKQPRGKDEDCDPTPYTVNEQLLLSGIAHLDMPATLRALDTLLPPACQSKKPSSQCRSGPKKRLARRRQPKPSDRNGIPYFDRQVRPRPFSPRAANSGPPETKLQFQEYSQYTNRMHEIPNERSRWFAEYQFHPEKRVIKNLLTEELNRLISGEPLEDTGCLCKTHRWLEDRAKLQREEKAYEVFRRCVSQLDVPGSELRARRKSIVADLEREIECAADKMREDSRRLLSHVKSIRNEGGLESCQLCNLMVCTPRQKTIRRADLSILMGLSNGDKPKVHLFDQQKTGVDQVKVMLFTRKESNRCGAGDCKFMEPEGEDKLDTKSKQLQLEEDPSQKLQVGSSSKLARQSGNAEERTPETPLRSRIFEELPDRTSKCRRSSPYFIRKAANDPETTTFTTRTVRGIELNYKKIFETPEPLPLEDSDYVDVEDKQPVIEKLCIAALNDGQSNTVRQHELRPNEIPSPVLRAAATCAVDTFRTNLAKAKKDTDTIESKQEKGDELIDPNNKQQIADILKAAMQVLRANPYFVLASFPNAHKLPVLLDWVADRYGKSFSQEEMHALMRSSLNLYERIYLGDRAQQRQVLRMPKGIAEISGSATYANLKSLLCLSSQRKAKYHSKLNEMALEQTRLTWMALRGYSHLGGQIKDTFFAYMPAREIDLMREHMWKSHDYRNMVYNRVKSRERRSA